MPKSKPVDNPISDELVSELTEMLQHPERFDEEGNRKVATQTEVQTEGGTRERKPVPVTFGLQAIPGPPKQVRIGTPSSPVHALLKQIAEGDVPTGPEHWYVIARYPTEDKRAGSAASAKAGDLRKRYPESDGWEFKVGSDGDDKVVAVCKAV